LLPDEIFRTAELLLLVRFKRSRFPDRPPVWANAHDPGRTREPRCASQGRRANTPLPRLLGGRITHEREVGGGENDRGGHSFHRADLQTGESMTLSTMVPPFTGFHARSACNRLRYYCIASYRSVQFNIDDYPAGPMGAVSPRLVRTHCGMGQPE
jgi:hypothetical protein